MDLGRNERGFCVGFAWNLSLFSFVREREGYKHHADRTVYTITCTRALNEPRMLKEVSNECYGDVL